MRRRVFAVSLLAVLAGCAGLYGQLTRGFISGSVQDATGGALEGAAVSITNTATGIKRDTTTNAAGVYRFVAVEPGTYTVEFSKGGFESRRANDIQVGVTQEVVLNQVLGVGSLTTTVEVLGSSSGVDLAKATATIDRKLDHQMVEALPTTAGTRDVTRLALLAPTVVRGTGSNEFSANGQRARNNNFTIDGVDNNDASVTLPSTRIIPEMVGEFHVQTSAFSAEFGRNSGAQVSVITRAGSNRWQGEVYNFYSAQWMEPLTLQEKRTGATEKSRYNQNQAGGALGGPIHRDRTFFFALIDANRRRESARADNAATFSIPTAEGYAALSRVPLGTGQTAQSRQGALNALSFLPGIHSQVRQYSQLTNVIVNAMPIQVGTGRIPLANPFDFWYGVLRVDHQLTPRDSLSYRNLFDRRNQPDVISNLQFGSRFSGAQTILGQSHSLSHIRNFTPRLINEFRFSYSRRNLDFPENDPLSPTVGITGAFTIGGASSFPQSRIQNNFQWQNVSTWLVGRHSLKMGADVRRLRLFDLNGFDTKGTWTFNSLADFLNNSAFSLVRTVRPAQSDSRQNLLYYFFQDDVKLTRDLTLNLGLRYEFTSYPFGFFGATQPEVRAAGVPGPTRGDKNNWAPRFGLAYSPSAKSGLAGRLLGDGQTVFRGGYGVGYDVVFLNLISNFSTNYPNSQTLVDTGLNHVFPNFPPVAPIALNPLARFIVAPEDMQNPTTHFYNFSIQRQLAAHYVFEIGYSGSRSYHGLRQGEFNPGVLTADQAQRVIQSRNQGSIPGVQARRLNPVWGSRLSVESNANANYNALFTRLDKKLTRGLIVGANYTFSALLSDNDESLAVGNLADSSPPVPQDYFNYRPEWARSAFDRPHRFVFHYIYQTPWFSSGPANHAVLRRAFKDWQIAGSSEWQSGQPFSIRTGVDSLGNGRPDSARPDYNPGGILTKDPVQGNFRTFISPLDGSGALLTPLTAGGLPLASSMPRGGNLGRNTYRGPAFTLWNFSVSKTFPLTERLKLRVRNDMVNLWNHRNFGPPENRLVSPAFGQNVRAQVANAGRLMLFSAKVSW